MKGEIQVIHIDECRTGRIEGYGDEANNSCIVVGLLCGYYDHRTAQELKDKIQNGLQASESLPQIKAFVKSLQEDCKKLLDENTELKQMKQRAYELLNKYREARNINFEKLHNRKDYSSVDYGNMLCIWQSLVDCIDTIEEILQEKEK